MIELFINNAPCDTDNRFSVRLKRQFLTPMEVFLKDAQASYSITLPVTPANNKIFHYSIIEEVQNKFNRGDLIAELNIDGQRIFKGKFRLTEVSPDGYKGNLIVPVQKTVKDVFGDLKLTQLDPYHIEFGDFAQYVSHWNNKAKTDDTPCIFPFVLYGLLPKIPDIDGSYSPRNTWDETVRIGIEDLPPSLNVFQMIRHAFRSKGYQITGDAFDDIKLSSLFASYKNANDYAQEWNWGDLASVEIKGKYQSIKDIGTANAKYERQMNKADLDNGHFYSVDLFNCNNIEFTQISDTGANVIKKETTDRDNTITNLILTIPKSGLYKVRFKANLEMRREWKDSVYSDPKTGQRWTNASTGSDHNYDNYFRSKRYELQVLRDFGTGDFNMENRGAVGSYQKPNQMQNMIFNNKDVENYPKWFPPIFGKIYVDCSNSENFVNGLKFGQARDYADYNVNANGKFEHSKDISGGTMAIKNGKSIDPNYKPSHNIISASRSDEPWRFYGTKEQQLAETEEGEIEGDDSEVLDWFDIDKYEIDISNIPAKYIDSFNITDECKGNGQVTSVIYLEKGESLTVAFVSESGFRRRSGHSVKRDYGAVICENLTFELEIEPFKTTSDWVTIDHKNKGIEAMDFAEDTDFLKSKIDLVKFLPDIKADEWITQICNAFNLKLTQIEDSLFSLDLKQPKKMQTSQIVDLDNIANLKNRANQPLDLPSEYRIGFTVKDTEEGYAQTQYDGGGTFSTGSDLTDVVEQKSNFSYNWYKEIMKGDSKLIVPIISDSEVWTSEMLYSDAMLKRYYDYGQRFWYFDNLLNNGAYFKFGQQEKNILIAKVTNEMRNLSILDYADRKNTLLNNYFTLTTSASSHYTVVECYLTPDMYAMIGNGANVRFNGDVYRVAEIDGYDPQARNKCTLKLIRGV